jgi:hypothetical protein
MFKIHLLVTFYFPKTIFELMLFIFQRTIGLDLKRFLFHFTSSRSCDIGSVDGKTVVPSAVVSISSFTTNYVCNSDRIIETWDWEIIEIPSLWTLHIIMKDLVCIDCFLIWLCALQNREIYRRGNVRIIVYLRVCVSLIWVLSYSFYFPHSALFNCIFKFTVIIH